MTDEKKTLRGGLSPELSGTALNEDALEGVAGGGQSAKWMADAWDWLQKQGGSNEDKEQQP